MSNKIKKVAASTDTATFFCYVFDIVFTKLSDLNLRY